ncbi:hypothetical protein [Acinetobacter sp. CIP 102136]|uniref:hypothetical protein n=1 Tax=Acinetobacter sp. CIP 102136 TaxID=1144665 RepID=UPI0002CFFDF4|nr:hypothetical protein [Acinetobacter sp. CIP 102136]ENX21057.1 hypothetical protein F893_01938 [Acinetobacter sp. CIP 102136]
MNAELEVNSFKAGDKIVSICGDYEGSLLEVEAVLSRKGQIIIFFEYDDTICDALSLHFRHARDAEIDAGKWIEVA